MPSVKDMTDNGFDYSNCKRIGEEDYRNLVKQGCQPEVGDILISKDGTMLKTVFTVKRKEPIVILSSIAIIKPIANIVYSDYLTQYFKNEEFVRKAVNENKTGTGVPRIVLKNFKQLNIPVPSLPEQQKIASFLSSIDDRITLIDRQLENLKQYKKSLLQQMFV